MQIIYLVLCITGAALPLAQFIPWLADRGLDFPHFIQEAVATRTSSFAWADVLISGLVFVIFVRAERRRLGMRQTWPSFLGLAVGVSLALPLFLLLRERHLSRLPPNTSLERTRGR